MANVLDYLTEKARGLRSVFQNEQPSNINRLLKSQERGLKVPTSSVYNYLSGTPVNLEANKPKELPKASPSPSPKPTPQAATSEMFPYLQSPVSKEEEINQMIISAAKEQNLIPDLLAALFTQETGRFNPEVIYGPQGYGPEGRQDFGIGQINEYWHPEVTREQALDPTFAIPWAAKQLRSNIDYFGGDVSKGVASYNVGRGGASVEGPTPYGGGPKGQTYLDNVARNLTDELLEDLGLKTSPNLRD